MIESIWRGTSVLDRATSVVHSHLQRAGELLAEHDPSGASDELDRGLSADFENADIMTALKYVRFWMDRDQRLAEKEGLFERGEFLLDQWVLFQAFVERVGTPVEPMVNACRNHVFGLALEAYRGLYNERSNREARLLVRIGRCYKGLGDYERALRFLRAAAVDRSDDAEILAELADALALSGEMDEAKAFFREAFFVGPADVALPRLESELIVRLTRAVEERGFSGALTNEWIPVFGLLYGVLNVKRELRSIEIGRLKQSIFELERELREGTGNEALVRPRLLNRYFWLLDHYVAVREAQDKIDEVLLKIRSVDSDVYHKYTA